MIIDEEFVGKLEEIILPYVQINGEPVQNLINEGRLVIALRCKDCKYRSDGLVAMVDGKPKIISSPRCSRWFSFVDDEGWCYKAERKEE